MMNLIRAIVIHGQGSDKCFIETDLPDPCWPYVGKLSLSFTAAADEGEKYINKNWPNLSIEIVSR